MKLTIIGAGAIGGTLGAHMFRAGHDITLVDADENYVAAIQRDGLQIEGPVNEFTVKIPAITPAELPDTIEHAIVAVKSLHTASAAALLRDRLAPDGVNLVNSNGPAAWQTVFHFHVHVIPRYRDDPLRLPWVPSQGDLDEIGAAAQELSAR